MKNDLEMIVHKMDRGLEYINIYPMCEPHVGSPNFNENSWYKWKQMLMDDPNGYFVITGDALDTALKGSKTNSYHAKYSPFEAKEWLKRELKEIAHKCLGAVKGNHEERSTDAVDGCPLYDVMAKYDLEDVYRPNMAFMKINLGERRSDRQVSYGIVLGHGASRAKVEKFGYAIDGVDIMITGHTHSPENTFPAKIVMDMQNEVVRVVDFTRLVVPSFQDLGGYTLRGMYAPQSSTKIPIIRLDGKKKGVSITWI